MLNGVKLKSHSGTMFHRMKSIATILVFRPTPNASKSLPVNLPNI